MFTLGRKYQLKCAQGFRDNSANKQQTIVKVSASCFMRYDSMRWRVGSWSHLSLILVPALEGPLYPREWAFRYVIPPYSEHTHRLSNSLNAVTEKL